MRYFVTPPPGSVRVADGHLEIEAPNEMIAVWAARYPAAGNISGVVYNAITDAFGSDPTLLEQVSAMEDGIPFYTLGKPVTKNSSGFRIPFVAYCVDATRLPRGT